MSRPRPLPGQRIEFLLSTREQHDLFGDVVPASYARDARSRWGETDVWAAASGRVNDYTLDEWMAIAADQQDWERRVVALLASGARADGEDAIALAEEHRSAIERWYFTCPPQLHREIMDSLLDDPSFRVRYEGLASGTADFLRAAVQASSARAAPS